MLLNTEHDFYFMWYNKHKLISPRYGFMILVESHSKFETSNLIHNTEEVST